MIALVKMFLPETEMSSTLYVENELTNKSI